MKIGSYTLYLLFFVLLTCSEDKASTVVPQSENTSQEPVITEKAINNLKYTDYALSAESENVAENWEKYQELAIQINYLKKADLSFFNGDYKVLKVFIEELRTATPEQLLTNPIISRTVILETALLRLNENLNLENISDTTKLDNIKEVLIAFSNLNYQINKKLERDLYDKIQPE